MNPGNELQPPIGSIQAYKARADLIHMHGPGQERLSKGSIMSIGGRKQKKERSSRTALNQGVDAIAAQERAGILSWRMAIGSIGVSATPGKDGEGHYQ